MGILTNLNLGKKIKFEETDNDNWGYDGSQLIEYVEGSATGVSLTVVSVSEEEITIDWGGINSTLTESKFIWKD
jgi:hypothetical protein